jgi:hypothetical protein
MTTATDSDRRHPRVACTWLVLMLAGNTVLMFCMVGVCILAIHQVASDRTAPAPDGTICQIVHQYMADHMPAYHYRVRQWYPPEPLDGTWTTSSGGRWEPVRGEGVAQRVRIQFYAPSRAKQLDAVYWVQGGKVTNVVAAEHMRFPGESVRKWERRRPLSPPAGAPKARPVISL